MSTEEKKPLTLKEAIEITLDRIMKSTNEPPPILLGHGEYVARTELGMVIEKLAKRLHLAEKVCESIRLNEDLLEYFLDEQALAEWRKLREGP